MLARGWLAVLGPQTGQARPELDGHGSPAFAGHRKVIPPLPGARAAQLPIRVKAAAPEARVESGRELTGLLPPRECRAPTPACFLVSSHR